jgi:hypothetical protein
MKTSRLFWGLFLLTIGVLVLLDKTGVFVAHWNVAWKFWPVVLVFWGIALLVGGKAVRLVAAAVAAVVLGFVLVSMFNMTWFDGECSTAPITQMQEMDESFDPSIKQATFSMESGAGSFSIGDTTSQLVHVITESSFGSYRLERNQDAEGVRVSLELNGNHAAWPPGRMRNLVQVNLNPAPVWDVRLDVGATRLNCDLQAFRVNRLQVNAGAASIHLTLGDREPETSVDIDAGASSIVLRVPSSAGCEVHLDAPMSSKKLPGFTKEGKGRYVTENFESAVKKVHVGLDAGVSSIKVERY